MGEAVDEAAEREFRFKHKHVNYFDLEKLCGVLDNNHAAIVIENAEGARWTPEQGSHRLVTGFNVEGAVYAARAKCSAREIELYKSIFRAFESFEILDGAE